MLFSSTRYIFAAVFALCLHLLLIGVMFFQVNQKSDFRFTAKAKTMPEPKAETIKSKVVSEEKVLAEIERLNAADRKEKAEQARQKRLAEQAAKKRAAEEAKLAALKKESQRQEAARKAKAQMEAKRLADLKKAQAQAESRRQAEQKRLAELQKKAEAAKKAQERRAREEALAQRLRDEEAQQVTNQIIEEFAGRINQRVTSNWLRPLGTADGLSCTLEVSLMPDGEVLDVKLVQSSGNLAFDRSSELAVKKSSPLPVPEDANAFASFRQFKFVFKPDVG